MELRNAPTNLMEELDYGNGYEYAHNLEHKLSKMQCLPDGLKDRVYYEPTDEGEEETVAKRLAQIREWKHT